MGCPTVGLLGLAERNGVGVVWPRVMVISGEVAPT